MVISPGSQLVARSQSTPLERPPRYPLRQVRPLTFLTYTICLTLPGMTVHGLSLYDSSFPIHDEATLIKVTNELRNLNRKTKETVNVTLYDFEHLIDFDDKIVLNGKTYFLSNNTARTTPRIKFEQILSLVRWY